jgi:hypothetical protein
VTTLREKLDAAFATAHEADARVSQARRVRFDAQRAYREAEDAAQAAWKDCDRIADEMVAADEPDPRMQEGGA